MEREAVKSAVLVEADTFFAVHCEEHDNDEKGPLNEYRCALGA
jgi:hypothetical protein